MASRALLETSGLTKEFESLTAVDDVDFTLERGGLHGIIGPNGAGKTTFFNLVTGLLDPTAGQIWFDGQEITGLPPHRITRRGIAMSFQLTRVFPDLTVVENVLGAINGRNQVRNPFVRYDGDPDRNATAHDILAQVGLDDVSGQRVGTLSHADQKVLELALALGTDPELLLLDEPTAGLSASETEAITALVQDLRDDMTIVLIEHDMEFVMNLVEDLTVFHNGEILAQGPPDAIRGNERVKEVYFGRELDA